METKFERVWNRVTGTEPKDDAGKLEEFIRYELRDAEDYKRLARRTGAQSIRNLLFRLSEDEHKHARKLQASSYLLFGGKAGPIKPQHSEDKRILSALRSKYAEEISSAEAYSSAARSTARDGLRTLYGELAAEERKHAEALCKLLESLL